MLDVENEEEIPMLSEEELNELPYNELRTLMRECGLKAKGKKAELIQILLEAQVMHLYVSFTTVETPLSNLLASLLTFFPSSLGFSEKNAMKLASFQRLLGL